MAAVQAGARSNEYGNRNISVSYVLGGLSMAVFTTLKKEVTKNPATGDINKEIINNG